MEIIRKEAKLTFRRWCLRNMIKNILANIVKEAFKSQVSDKTS